MVNRKRLNSSNYSHLIIFIVLTVVTSGHSATQPAQEPIESSNQIALPTICISPGHPSFEGDKLYEALINRKVAHLLHLQFERNGYATVTPIDDVNLVDLFLSDLHYNFAALSSNLEVVAPKEKAERCIEEGANYIISVHHNYALDKSKNKTVVFYGMDDNYVPIHSQAEKWAKITAKELGRVMKTEDSFHVADRERLGFPLGIITNSSVPTILTEGSFYSNPQEQQRLNDDMYLKGEAVAIFQAFQNHYTSIAPHISIKSHQQKK